MIARWLAVSCAMAAASCRAPDAAGTGIVLETEVACDREVYKVGERIAIFGIVRNLTGKPVTYRSSLCDLYAYRWAKIGEDDLKTTPEGAMVILGGWTVPYPTGGEPMDVCFREIPPGGNITLETTYTAKVPGKYRAHFEIDSATNVERLPDADFGMGSSARTSGRAEAGKGEKRTLVHENGWIGSVPPKEKEFEVR